MDEFGLKSGQNISSKVSLKGVAQPLTKVRPLSNPLNNQEYGENRLNKQKFLQKVLKFKLLKIKRHFTIKRQIVQKMKIGRSLNWSFDCIFLNNFFSVRFISILVCKAS